MKKLAEKMSIKLDKDKAAPFDIDAFQDPNMSEAEKIREIRKAFYEGLSKENPLIYNISNVKEPLYSELKQHLNEVLYVGDIFCVIKYIKIVEE